MSIPCLARASLTVLAAILLLPGLAAAGTDSGRGATPPPVLDPVSAFPDDNAPELGAGGGTPVSGERPGPGASGPLAEALRAVVYDQIGGDDETVYVHDYINDPSLDIASNGDIYAAFTRHEDDSSYQIDVLRSTDQGHTFSTWGTLSDPIAAENFRAPCLDVVEGTVEALYLVYERNRATTSKSEICLVSSPLGGASATWSAETTVMAAADVHYHHPRLATDVDTQANFYIYVVAEGDDDTGQDIWFARSINHGFSFETPYMLATLLVDDRRYLRPDIAYGFGGHLHVTWYFQSDDGSFDGSIRYRRASNFAGGGIADWDSWVTLTSTSDGYDDRNPRVEAGAIGNEVVVAYSRFTDDASPAFVDARIFIDADDAGAAFDPALSMIDGPYLIGDIEEQAGTGIWMMLGMNANAPALYTAAAADLGAWSGPAHFQDEPLSVAAIEAPDLALNPADGYRPAALWLYFPGGESRRLFFDADWKNDPGWPNLEPGFPMNVSGGTAPALADLDRDGDLEIVFSNAVNRVSALHHDGTPVAGWPVETVQNLADGPVAVGDLNGDGYPEVVVGTDDGEALAYDHAGDLLPGWPTTISGAGHPVYVSIGALGPPYPRVVVCTSYNRITYRNRSGALPPGAVTWTLGGTVDFVAPAAIGDIDADGVAEVVGARYTAVVAAEMLSPTYDFIVSTGHVASDAPTLGDLDFDGDLEILVPTEDGILLGLDHTGASLGGNFPIDTGDVHDLSSAALAQIRGLRYPDIAFGSESDDAYAFYHDGSAFPEFPRPAFNYSETRFRSPTLERIEGTSGDVVVGTYHFADCWDNYGQEIHGWPIVNQGIVRGSPAVADLDLDGRLEMVVLSDFELQVIDVNNPPDTPDRSWPMYGHDAQRTGCADCPEDVTTAVEPDPDGERITRVAFAAPSPNPATGGTRFSYAIPSRAAVSLEVYDVRGARVATVLREESGPGRSVLTWEGRDGRGAPLPSGVYFARLRVRGPGVDEELVRQVTLLR